MIGFLLLCLYTLFLLLRPQDFIEPLHGTPLMSIFLGGAMLLTLMRRDFGLRDVPSWALLFLLAVMVLSSAANGWLGGGVTIVREFGPVVATYLVYSHQLREPGRLGRLCLLVVACTTVMVVHSVQQLETGIGWSGARVVEGNRVTWVGIFNDPNDLGLMFLVAIPMILMRARLAASAFMRFCWYGLALFHVYGIYLTHSRGAVLTLLLLVAVAGYRRYGMARSAVAALLASPVMYMVLSGMRSINAEEESAAGRIEAWYTGIQLFKQNPFLGVGMNNFTEYHDLTAHNSYVLVLAELGLAGYLFWTLLIAASALMVWRARQSRLAAVQADDEALVSGPEGRAFGRRKPASNGPSPLVVEGEMLLYTMLAYLSAAFFLSRSYIVVLYMVCGMSVAYFHKVRAGDASLAAVTGKSLTGFLALFVPLSLVFLYLVVRVLL